jgi:HK97 family phage major capsid protein
MERIEELMQQRAALVTEQRRILDKAEGENRNLTGEETAEYDRMDGEFDSLDARIERLKDQRERQRSLAEAEAAAAAFDPNRDGDPNASEASAPTATRSTEVPPARLPSSPTRSARSCARASRPRRGRPGARPLGRRRPRTAATRCRRASTTSS